MNFRHLHYFSPRGLLKHYETNKDYLDDNNLGYTRELCEWSLDNAVRFVYASSASTYGDGSLGMDDEDEDLEKFTP